MWVISTESTAIRMIIKEHFKQEDLDEMEQFLEKDKL